MCAQGQGEQQQQRGKCIQMAFKCQRNVVRNFAVFLTIDKSIWALTLFSLLLASPSAATPACWWLVVFGVDFCQLKAKNIPASHRHLSSQDSHVDHTAIEHLANKYMRITFWGNR